MAMSQVNVNPGDRTESSAASGMSVALIFALVVVILLLVLAYIVLWPMLSAQPQPPGVNVNVRSSELIDGLAGLLA
jgi:hypothetical protein